MTKLPHLFVVAAALVDPSGRVLVQRRPADREHGGLWEFPGGKVEVGESPEAALVRELAEELALDVAPGDLASLAFTTTSDARRHLVLLLYEVRHWPGEPQPLHAAALRWVPAADLAGLAMPPADIPLIDAVRRRLAGG